MAAAGHGYRRYCCWCCWTRLPALLPPAPVPALLPLQPLPLLLLLLLLCPQLAEMPRLARRPPQRIVPPILASFTDQDSRVRYYAIESLWNVVS